MYGAIYGDLAGSVYEYEQTNRVYGISPNELIKEESFYSDDTILTIAILDAILHDKNYDAYLRKYIAEYENYKPDFKPYFKTTFSPNLIRWSKDNSIGISHGNGALMRISPVGFMFDSEREVKDNALLATIPSHNSNEAIDAATTVALMIYYFRNGMKKDEVFKKLNINVHYMPISKFNVTCEETLSNCLYVIYNSYSFDDAIRKTLLMGGDTDTNCAIVGSIAEALYGISDYRKEEVENKIPDEFVKVLRKATR